MFFRQCKFHIAGHVYCPSWCFDKNLEQARQKNPQNLPKDRWMNKSWGIHTLFYKNP